MSARVAAASRVLLSRGASLRRCVRESAALEPRPAADGEAREGPRLWGVPAADPRDASLDGGEESIQSPLLLAVPDSPLTPTGPRPRAARTPADGEVTGGREERAEWD